MKSHLNLQNLLETASGDMDFKGSDKNRIWDGATGKKQARKPKLRWLIPVAAACTVLVTLCAVPEARAAMVDFFGKLFNIFDYMSMNEGARPGNTAVERIIQKDIPADVSIVQIPGSADSDWVRKIKFHVDEALYDGKNLYVSYSLEAKGIEDFNNYRIPTEADRVARFKSIEPTGIWLPGNQRGVMTESWMGGHGPKKTGDGEWRGVVQYGYTGMELTGSVEAKLYISLNNITLKHDGNGRADEITQPAGGIEASFRFDASASGGSTRNLNVSGGKHVLSGNVTVSEIFYDKDAGETFVVNRSEPIDGSTLEVKSAVYSPVETCLTFHYKPSEAFERIRLLDCGNMRIELLDGDKVVGQSEVYSPFLPGERDIEVTAPFLPSDVKRLTVRASFQYALEFNGHPLALDKPVIYENTYSSSGEEYSFKPAETGIPGGTFDIDLTK